MTGGNRANILMPETSFCQTDLSKAKQINTTI